MINEVRAYIEYLANLKEIKRPAMPTFPTSAYNDNEYRIAVAEIMKEFQYVDDYYLTLQYLKGD